MKELIFSRDSVDKTFKEKKKLLEDLYQPLERWFVLDSTLDHLVKHKHYYLRRKIMQTYRSGFHYMEYPKCDLT